MSRYIITGKDSKSAASATSDLNEYFELGWEVTATFLEAYWRRKTERFHRDDIIVTASGREFLYQSLFDRVIDYKTFLALPDRKNAEVIDLIPPTLAFYAGAATSRLTRLKILAYHRFRYGWQYRSCFDKRDIASSTTIKIPDEPFVCVSIRVREHQPQRNMPESYWLELLGKLADKPCFVVGFGIEHLVIQPKHRICTLAEFAALCASPNCEGVIGTMTGPIQLAQLVHPRKLIVIDIDRHYPFMNRITPCVLSYCANLANVQHSLYMYIPSVDEILDDLAGNAGPSRINPLHLGNRQYQRMIRLDRKKGHGFYEFPKKEFETRAPGTA